MRFAFLAGLALLLTPPALAQGNHATTACSTADAELPAGFADWHGAAAIKTVASAADGATAELTPGKGYMATLLNKRQVTFAVEPEKPGGSASFSGLFKFTVETAGAYTVALGSAAWIDVVEDGKSLEPVSFGHGPECTTIRKMVTFNLKPGAHLLQLAGNGSESVRLLVAKRP